MKSAATLSEKLLTAAFQAHASDIHFFPFPNETNIYFRIHGKRTHYQTISTSTYQLLLTYYKFTSGMDIGEIRKPQNGTMTFHQAPKSYSLRLSTLPLQPLESLAIRILPQQDFLTLDQLFLFPSQLKQMKRWMNNRSGIILVTGPTGSGKTTTLYALLETIIQDKSYQAITLEDPIEKNLHDILQVQVNKRAGVTYHAGLRAALRHDPDMIMIGEIRDTKTAQFAFEASLTGHLVLSTLHAKNAEGTIYRLLDMGLTRTDLKQSLLAVAALQLLPITIGEGIKRRAAILELLDESFITDILNGKRVNKDHIQTFDHLRKKAYAYGFISKETLFSNDL